MAEGHDERAGSPVPADVPRFTESLDAKIGPDENIVSVQHEDATGKWIAISKSENGALYIGVGNTEALARRIAGLKALDARRRGLPPPPFLTPPHFGSIERDKLGDALERLADAVAKNNEYAVQAPEDQKRRLLEIKGARDLLRSPGAFATGAAMMLMSTLTYLAVKFADGVIAKLAEIAAHALDKLLGG